MAIADGGVDSAATSLSIQVKGAGSGQNEPGAPCNRVGGITSPAIQTLQVTIRSESGAADCCLAFDPCNQAFANRRQLLLSLPGDAEPVDVSLSAFTADETPAAGDSPQAPCTTSPRNVGDPCGSSPCEVYPIGRGQLEAVRVQKGKTTVVTVDVDPHLILRDPDPACGTAVPLPEEEIKAIPFSSRWTVTGAFNPGRVSVPSA